MRLRTRKNAGRIRPGRSVIRRHCRSGAFLTGNATWLKAVYDDFLSCDVDAARANGQVCGSTAPLVNVGGSTRTGFP